MLRSLYCVAVSDSEVLVRSFPNDNNASPHNDIYYLSKSLVSGSVGKLLIILSTS